MDGVCMCLLVRRITFELNDILIDMFGSAADLDTVYVMSVHP